jgi:hypothetical protein
MLEGFDSVVNEIQAMQAQIEFLKGCATDWRRTPVLEETDHNVLTQLVLTIYYFKEGLEELYRHENYFLQLKPRSITADEIKLRQQDVMNILDGIYRSLVNLSGKMQILNKESIWNSIDRLCHSVIQLCGEEN